MVTHGGTRTLASHCQGGWILTIQVFGGVFIGVDLEGNEDLKFGLGFTSFQVRYVQIINSKKKIDLDTVIMRRIMDMINPYGDYNVFN